MTLLGSHFISSSCYIIGKITKSTLKLTLEQFDFHGCDEKITFYHKNHNYGTVSGKKR